MADHINFEAEAEHLDLDEVSDFSDNASEIHLLTITIRMLIQMLTFREVLQVLKMTLNRF